ncbi:hypothetical protein [Hymenobacter volaticus]|uniref:Uncharacterized protein n=1 Tax=Hymenobacter volaticus TaxID=2932254 RepID=A0ABY4G265_9BACT|nr:hypothetical protein [Hymenobacter volaticus]UOQ64871.1 hypothetical protein MUN86_15010 [Hymenobacter volaticus]
MHSVFLLGDNLVSGTLTFFGIVGLIVLVPLGLLTALLVRKARRNAQRFTEKGLFTLLYWVGAFVAGCFALAWMAQQSNY